MSIRNRYRIVFMANGDNFLPFREQLKRDVHDTTNEPVALRQQVELSGLNKNNQQIADLILQWINERVQKR